MSSLRNLFKFVRGKLVKDILRNQHDIIALQQLVPLATSYVPWSVFSLRPSAVVIILNEIMANKCHTIVECGAGISTLFIARLLKQIGGQLITLEHDTEWADRVQEMLERDGLTDFVTIITTQLVHTDFAIDQSPWYDLRAVESAIGDFKIDLLIVDGPPAYDKNTKYARYPAVPVFRPYFAEEFTVIMDDIDREGEDEIVSRWSQILKIPFSRMVMNGIAIGSSKEGFAT